MDEWTLFGIYRYLLALVVGIYATLQLASFIWQWQADLYSADRGEALLRRYLDTLLIRTRLRRQWWDFVQVLALAGILAYLLTLHR